MSRNLVGNYALLNIFFVWQAKVFFRRHVAKHCCAVPAVHGGANGTGDVVVARSDVGDQRAKHIEGSTVANFDLLPDVDFDLVHRNVAWTFEHDLRAICLAASGQFAKHIKLRKLSGIRSVGDRTGAKSIAE